MTSGVCTHGSWPSTAVGRPTYSGRAIDLGTGRVGETTLHVGEAPDFRVGETVVLFLKSGGPCGVYGWFRGKYTVVDDKIRERRSTSFAEFRALIQAEVEK